MVCLSHELRKKNTSIYTSTYIINLYSMQEKKVSIQAQLKDLENIATWFEKDDAFDVEEGLRKVKEGAELVKKLKTRLKEVENEFRELEVEMTEEE
ncbi:MAG: hypothetical protein UU98_C0044G0003 [Parcubacteria group bacterium GW2011_GWD2_42_14]|nr:MAG: hypothetical protein UU98_C0044G0003 [Parcubacteria group bacterium GW2011_GWD2_42_14]